MIFGNRPGTAIGGFRVKNTGIKGIGMGFGEPLLDREIVSNFLIRIKCPSDNGIGAIGSYDESRGNGMCLLVFQIGNGKAVVFSFQFRADGIAMNLHPFGNDGFQPQVEFMPVQIDIKPLIMADQPVFQVDGFYRKNLRIYQNILGRVRSKDARAFWASAEISPPQGF